METVTVRSLCIFSLRFISFKLPSWTRDDYFRSEIRKSAADLMQSGWHCRDKNIAGRKQRKHTVNTW
jgi:hypothetical protein